MKKFLLIAVVALMSITASAQAPKTGFRFGVNTGYVAATAGEGSSNNWNFDLTAGCQIVPALYVGGGAGLDVYTKEGRNTPLDLPIFGEIKAFIPNTSKFQPFVGVRGGYAINLDKTSDSGVLDFTVGVEFAKIFNLSVGYNVHIYTPEDNGAETTQTVGYVKKIKRTRSSSSAATNPSASIVDGFVVRIGCRF